MLDKSLEYKHIIMRLNMEQFDFSNEPVLPEGFSFKFFTPSDIQHWGRIETSVLEFNSEFEACRFFERAYMPYAGEPEKRCLFVVNPDSLPVATASYWSANCELGYQASLHWVAACPEYQGLGIGRAVVTKILNASRSIEPAGFIWLHTQTWSHVAVRLYHSLGFNMVREGLLANLNTVDGRLKLHGNEFDDAIRVLRTVMDGDYVDELYKSAV